MGSNRPSPSEQLLARATSLLAALLVPSMALALPRDSVTWSAVPSSGLINTQANELRVLNVSDAYVATRLILSGTLSEIASDTWASDARILVSAPDGVQTVVRPFSSGSFDGSINVSNFVQDLSLPLGQASGQWRFRFYEDFVDAANGPDARWESISFSLDDTTASSGWFESTDAGETPATRQQTAGHGPLARIGGRVIGAEADVFLIEICDPSAFSASTVDRATWDTQLFLFREDGAGIAYNDDSPDASGVQSRLSAQFVPAPGRYLLGISEFGRMPYDLQSRLMWLPEPRQVERFPDGPGSGGLLNTWAAPSNGPGGIYEISLTGACFIPPVLVCPADVDDGTETGHRDGAVNVSDILFYIQLFEWGDIRADLDDGTGSGTHDQGVDINDILYFLTRFEMGC